MGSHPEEVPEVSEAFSLAIADSAARACGGAWRGFGMMTAIITITTRKGGGG